MQNVGFEIDQHIHKKKTKKHQNIVSQLLQGTKLKIDQRIR